MSFSSDVKAEIARNECKRRHCNMAELAAMMEMTGRIGKDEENKPCFYIGVENPQVARKCFTLLKKTFNMVTDVSEKHEGLLRIRNEEDFHTVMETLKIGRSTALTDPLLISRECCKRAFLRGAFLAGGSMNDPAKSYHLEIVTSTGEKAEQLMQCMRFFGLDAKVVPRKGNFVVYLKEGGQIVDFLGIIEAHVALMEMENARILKEMRNQVNRQVNCETANLNKTIRASVRQLEDIRYLRDYGYLEDLPESLRQMAYVSLEHPDATLAELGELTEPPIGKSGVNHRLRRLCDIAEKQMPGRMP